MSTPTIFLFLSTPRSAPERPPDIPHQWSLNRFIEFSPLSTSTHPLLLRLESKLTTTEFPAKNACLIHFYGPPKFV